MHQWLSPSAAAAGHDVYGLYLAAALDLAADQAAAVCSRFEPVGAENREFGQALSPCARPEGVYHPSLA